MADLAVGVADDGNLPALLYRTCQGQRPHGAGHGAGDDVAGVAQPDELIGRYAQYIGEKSIESRINAGEGDDGQFIRKIGGMQAGIGIPGDRPVIGIHDGFEESHKKALNLATF